MDKMDEAYKKALVVKERRAKFFTCLKNGICPHCAGENLQHFINKEGFECGDDYECPDCSWKWSNLVEEE